MNIRKIFLALVALATVPGPARTETFEFATPSDDRWHYPFDSSAGTRAIAACFSSVGGGFPTFNDRDGIYLIGWETKSNIPSDQCPASYPLESVEVILTHTLDAAWAVDLTTDEWFRFDVDGDGSINHGEQNDLDPGRPLEMFGVGFGPEKSYDTWTEATPYLGANQFVNRPRDPFPIVFQDGTFDMLHVEDSVKGAHNDHLIQPVSHFTPRPWAIGVPINYRPGQQMEPFPVSFTVDLSLSNGAVRRYFQQQLSGGRVIVAVTSLQETTVGGGGAGEYATFYCKEGVGLHPLANAPKLVITLGEHQPSGDANNDCRVDLSDAAALVNCLSGPGVSPMPTPPTTPQECLQAFDFDSDSDVDLDDVAAFSNVFEGPK